MQHDYGFTYENVLVSGPLEDATNRSCVASLYSRRLPMKSLVLLRCCIVWRGFREKAPTPHHRHRHPSRPGQCVVTSTSTFRSRTRGVLRYESE
jgi:hypothetical protein